MLRWIPWIFFFRSFSIYGNSPNEILHVRIWLCQNIKRIMYDIGYGSTEEIWTRRKTAFWQKLNINLIFMFHPLYTFIWLIFFDNKKKRTNRKLYNNAKQTTKKSSELFVRVCVLFSYVQQSSKMPSWILYVCILAFWTEEKSTKKISYSEQKYRTIFKYIYLFHVCLWVCLCIQ